MDIEPIIYLDYNATTPVDPEVVNEMLPVFLSNYGNPSSDDHLAGWRAKEMVVASRKAIAACIAVKNQDIIFTAGATEAINLVLRGMYLTSNNQPKHLITVVTEHKAVLDTCTVLESNGISIDYLQVDTNGIIDLNELTSAIIKDTYLVSVMMVNNETGVMQPIKEIASICKKEGILFMSDTTQAIGKMPVNKNDLGIDILVGSAHKFYGPKGVGFLCAKADILKEIEPIITGGGQERGIRAGTTDVPAIVGMSTALGICLDSLKEDTERITSLRQRFETQLANKISIKIIGVGAKRLYNVANISFSGVDSERLMQAIGSKVAASRGSACSSDKIEASHVLTAMGILEEEALSSIRFSFGRYTTEKEVDTALELITEAVSRIKN